MIPLLLGQRQAHSPNAETAESQMPSPLSWGIGRAVTLLKTLLQYYGKFLEALPGVAYPGFRDNRSTLNIKTGYKKSVLQYATFKTWHILFSIITCTPLYRDGTASVITRVCLCVCNITHKCVDGSCQYTRWALARGEPLELTKVGS